MSAPAELSTAKFLILSINPFTGFANRFYAIASAFLLCLALGDRVLVIDWPHDETPRRHPNGTSLLVLVCARTALSPKLPPSAFSVSFAPKSVPRLMWT
jgi:hypothetical protein